MGDTSGASRCGARTVQYAERPGGDDVLTGDQRRVVVAFEVERADDGAVERDDVDGLACMRRRVERLAVRIEE